MIATIIILIIISAFMALVISNNIDSTMMSRGNYHIKVSYKRYSRTYVKKNGGILTLFLCASDFSLARIYTAFNFFRMKIL